MKPTKSKNYQEINNRYIWCLIIAIVCLPTAIYLISNKVYNQGSVDGQAHSWHSTNTQMPDEDTDLVKESGDIFFDIKDIQVSASNVFFIESRCITNKSAEYFKGSRESPLTGRQSCAIESTARANPDR